VTKLMVTHIALVWTELNSPNNVECNWNQI